MKPNGGGEPTGKVKDLIESSFGDINNKESEVYKRKKDDRVYHLLEYVGTKPNVFYHVKVRNNDKLKNI